MCWFLEMEMRFELLSEEKNSLCTALLGSYAFIIGDLLAMRPTFI